MTRVGVKEFRQNLKKYLKEMPVGVTHRGDLIAILVKPDFLNFLVENAARTEPTVDDTGDGTEVPPGVVETV